MAVPTPQRSATRSNKRRNVLEHHAPEVVAILATGEQPAEVARIYSVERSSVTRFVERHTDAIEAMRAEVIEQAQQFLIADKMFRIGALDGLFQQMAEEARAYGIVETGEDGRYFRDKLVNQMRGVLKDAAEELGQITPPDKNPTGPMREIIMREYFA